MKYPDRVGFIGSDVFEELPDGTQAELNFVPILPTDVDVVLATELDRVNQVFEAIIFGSRGLNIATSYERKARNIAGRLNFQINKLIPYEGAVEGAFADHESLDAIVELRQSGDSLVQNGLGVILGGLGKISIGAVWKKQAN